MTRDIIDLLLDQAKPSDDLFHAASEMQRVAARITEAVGAPFRPAWCDSAMTAVFTPGPWRACKDGGRPCRQVWSIPGDFPVCTANGVHVGAVHQHMADTPDMIYASITEATQRANTALITAAPDMYAALDAFVGMSPSDDVNAIIEQAKAALAKARGETT